MPCAAAPTATTRTRRPATARRAACASQARASWSPARTSRTPSARSVPMARTPTRPTTWTRACPAPCARTRSASCASARAGQMQSARVSKWPTGCGRGRAPPKRRAEPSLAFSQRTPSLKSDRGDGLPSFSPKALFHTFLIWAKCLVSHHCPPRLQLLHF